MRLLWRAEAEADAAHGLEVVRRSSAVSPSLPRSQRTCTSSVLVEPNQFSSHTRSISVLAGDDAAGVADELGQQVELLAGERELLALRVARRAARSTWRSSIEIGGSGSSSAAARLARRSTARMRAITSAPLNGLTT